MNFTTCLFNSISYASSATTSSCRNRLLLMSADVPTSVQYLTSRWRSTLVTVFPYPELPSSLIVSAMIALSGSVSPARRAAETDSPNHRKHEFGSYSTTWYTGSTISPCARYHRNSCVESNIFSPRYLPTSMRR